MARLVLTGLPGSGKTHLGGVLAQHYGVDFCDVDQLIMNNTALTIKEIFSTLGEAEFRRLEYLAVMEALRSYNGVVALGGGAVVNPLTRVALAGEFVVYLTIDADEGLRRVQASPTVRPLFEGRDAREVYERLIAERTSLYEEVASVSVHTTGKSIGQLVAEISALRNQMYPQSF